MIPTAETETNAWAEGGGDSRWVKVVLTAVAAEVATEDAMEVVLLGVAKEFHWANPAWATAGENPGPIKDGVRAAA